MPKILIVEDDPAVREILKIALEREGITVEAVENGEAARQSFRSVGVASGGFRDWFGPHDVHVYRFQL